MKDEELKRMQEVEVKDTLIFQGKVVGLHEYDVRLPNGNTAKREVVRHCQGATILALNDKGECLLEHQFRFAYNEVLLELPAGKCEEGEDPLVAARRELEEETGYKAGKLTKLGMVNPNPALFSNHVHFYLAEDLQATGKQHLDEDEFINCMELTKEEVLEGMGTEQFPHAIMGMALSLYIKHNGGKI